ncbi:MAG: molecular chaperone HtpG [Candidatus Hodarchaeales archaeon]
MSNNSDTDTPVETYEFQAEIQKLLQIIIHSLYTNREIFLRELISNSSDALNKVRFKQLTEEVYDNLAPFEITVTFNQDEKTLTVSDTGIGMSAVDIKDNLGTIASSGTLSFLESLKNQQAEGKDLNDKMSDIDVIGQFGVGFYSVFMIADEVIVRSRSFRADDNGIEWKSKGTGTYSIQDYPKEERGTDVIIKLKEEDSSDYLSEWKLKNIITKYSDYVPFPIFLDEDKEEEETKEEDVKEEETKEEIKEGEEEETKEEEVKEEERKPVNSQTSLWRKQPNEVSEEEYEKFYQHVASAYDKPFYQVHYSIDAPIQFKTLLFFPEKKNRNLFMPEPEWGLKLYSHNVLIQEKSKDLLPVYLRFIKGVVDSEDIPLNVSRETVQLNKVLERIKKSLTRKVISEISKIAKKKPDEYKKFWEELGIFIKEGIASDITNKDKLNKLLRFHSNKIAKDEYVSLDDYIDRMVEDQPSKIYYLLGDSLEVIQNSPHLDYYNEKGYEVLFLPEAIDGFVMMNLRDYEGKNFESIDQATPEEVKKEGEEEKKDVDEESDLGKLLKSFKDVLGEQVVEVRVSERLRESPVRLVNPAGGFGSEMQRVYRVMDENFEIPKKILEVNKDHSIITGLTSLHTTNSEDELVKATIEQLFENALLVEGLHPEPGKIVPRINMIIDKALNS